MNELVLSIVFVGNLVTTSYRSVPKQTDASPFNTSTGERCNVHGAAISQDLLCKACRKKHRRCAHPENPTKLHYGDFLYIEGVGYRFINDVMNKRHTNRLDVWVETYKDEKSFQQRHESRAIGVWKVKL